MLAYNARPPDPRFVGERWREMWLERMERTPPFVEAWLTHQHRDAFWKQGSVCENYADITCPVYAVGGWADGYSNAIFRLLAGLPGPRKGLIGPWSHNYPELGKPGPAIGFLQDCLRWWDYWLKGIDTGIMDEPMLRVWMQESVTPQTDYEIRPGRWVSEPSWPPPAERVTDLTYWLNDGTLDQAATTETQLSLKGKQANGLEAGLWYGSGRPGDLPSDQQVEDGQSLCFISAPLKTAQELLGFPEVTLSIAVDKPNALLAVRLCDVAPSGNSTLVSRGLLNLTHHRSHEQPIALEPGRRYTITIRLNGIAHSLPAGHRWRLAVSPTYWPHAWPSPEAVTLNLFAGPNSRLVLPVRTLQDQDTRLIPFEPPEGAAPVRRKILRKPTRKRIIHRDLIQELYQLKDTVDGGCHRLLDNGLEYEAVYTNVHNIVENDPLSASVRCDRLKPSM
jgi:putative CocE/NonD family hydrolase